MQAMPHLSLEGQRILLIAGIANPTPLVQYLEEKGAAVEVVAFADHHAFTTKDVARIKSSVARKAMQSCPNYSEGHDALVALALTS